MSLASTTVFEVRPGTGNDANGGGFDSAASGTDYSQQAAAQIAYTDLMIDAMTNTKCTSTANPFGAASPGNVINVTGGPGFTVQRVQIVSVAGGVATCDKALGATASFGGTGNLGGAMATINATEALLTAGMTAWIKADGTSQVLTTPIVTVGNGDSTSGPITWQGYHTTRGDHDGTRPLITSSTNSCDLLRCASGSTSYRIVDNIEWTSTAVTRGNGIATDITTGNWKWLVISNCYIHNVNNGIIADNGATYLDARQLFVVNCEITGCATDGIAVCDTTTISGCYIHGNSGYGLRVANPPALSATNMGLPIVIRDSVFYSNALGGAYVLSTASVSNTAGFMLDVDRCAFVSNTNDGLKNDTANAKLSMLSLQNSILYGNSGYGANITNGAMFVVANRNNAYGGNTSGARNKLAIGTADVTLTADPFVGRTTNNFSLNATAGGGAACRAAGFPGSIPSLVTAGYADIGALQHQDAGGGSVTNIVSTPRRVYSLPAARVFRRATAVIPGSSVTVSVPLPYCRRQLYRLPAFISRPRVAFPFAAQPLLISHPRAVR